MTRGATGRAGRARRVRPDDGRPAAGAARPPRARRGVRRRRRAGRAGAGGRRDARPPRSGRRGARRRRGGRRPSGPSAAARPASSAVTHPRRRLPGRAAPRPASRRRCCSSAATSRCSTAGGSASSAPATPPAGRETASALGRGLAEAGVAVVSGLAKGIDGAAHRGVLRGAGRPRRRRRRQRPRRPVPASSTPRCGPRSATAGVLLSEWPPGTPPEPFRFPMRNRILAALSEVLVVVESRERGGSSDHGARRPIERDVEVMAVPGSVRNRAAVGTNQLLRDGAAPVTDVDDVLVALGLDTPPGRAERRTTRARCRGASRPTCSSAAGDDPRTLDDIVAGARPADRRGGDGARPARARRVGARDRRLVRDRSVSWSRPSMSEYPRPGARPRPSDAAPASTRLTIASAAWRIDAFAALADVAVRAHRRGLRAPTCVASPTGRRARASPIAGRREAHDRAPLPGVPDDPPVRPPQHRPQGGRAAALLPLARRARAGSTADPTVGLQARGGDGRLPRVLDRRDLDELLDGAAPEDEPDWRRRRDDAVLEVLYGSGLRVSELCGLDIVVARPRPLGGDRVGQGRQGAAGAAVGSRRSRALRAWLAVRHDVSSTTPDAAAPAAVRQRAGQAAHAARRAADPRSALAVADPPARAAPQLRHPPARRRRRPPRRAGAARPRRRGHDAALHPRQPRAARGPPTRERPPAEHEHRRRRPVPGRCSGTAGCKRRSSSARDHLIVSYAPLVKFVAGRVGAGLPSSVDPGDLVSSGVLGLIDAIERFDPQRGVKFETFATPRIRGAIYDGLRELDWVPRSVRSRAREVERAIAELEARTRPVADRRRARRAPPDLAATELRQWLSSIASTTIGPLERALDVGAEPRGARAARCRSSRRRWSRSARSAT